MLSSGFIVMVCPCTFPDLWTRTDILMDTENFRNVKGTDITNALQGVKLALRR